LAICRKESAQKIAHADDLDPAKAAEREQVFVTGDDALRLGGDGAFENPVI
jgi:hypothetical protein